MTTDTTLPATTTGAAVDAADELAFVQRVREYAERVLRPSALRTDIEGMTRERIDELASLGLLNYLAPAEYAGAGLDPNADRRIHEIIAGACFNTWLVWAQHAALAGRLLATRDKLGSPAANSALGQRILRGQVLVGAGISDVRRYPDHYIAATRVDGGWLFTGTISWVSGWGLNEVLTVAAVSQESGSTDDTATVVTALVTLDERAVAKPLPLVVLSGSRTERVRLEASFVPDEHVLATQTLIQWRHQDLGISSDARAHHFGLAQTVLSELDAESHTSARAVADSWRAQVAAIRNDAYRLSDEATASGDTHHRLAERLALKAASGGALSVLSQALLVARSGRGLVAGEDTAQLHVRSALFVLVQGQSADVRSAQLSLLAEQGQQALQAQAQ